MQVGCHIMSRTKQQWVTIVVNSWQNKKMLKWGTAQLDENSLCAWLNVIFHIFRIAEIYTSKSIINHWFTRYMQNMISVLHARFVNWILFHSLQVISVTLRQRQLDDRCNISLPHISLNADYFCDKAAEQANGDVHQMLLKTSLVFRHTCIGSVYKDWTFSLITVHMCMIWPCY